MNTHTDTPVKPDDDRTAYLSPDPDMQRGRKRRRREEPGAALNTTRKQIPSGESATLRGRCRHRSTSAAAFSAFSSRSRSRSCVRDDGSFSPSNSKKRILRLVQLNGRRRRSQSPSRSRSTNRHRLSSCHDRRRRRQRTRSRSREHCKDHLHPHVGLVGASGVELKSPLCLEMTVDGDEWREGALEG